jgi:general secretion pathway protein H
MKPHSPARGFTLLELMVVVAVIAVGAAGVALSLRDSSQTALDREADRLAAVLESARAQSRSTGARLSFRAVPEGFVIDGLPQVKVQTWLNAGMQVAGAAPVVLGPEPMIEPSRITLQLSDQTRVVATDGLRPFKVGGANGP